MSKLKAIITVGISASGKTTFAKSLDNSWVNINRDDLRFSITSTKGWGDYRCNKSVENMVTVVQKDMCVVARASGKNIIISDTNINPVIREDWIKTLSDMGYTVEIKHFPIKLETAWRRDAMRSHGVGHSVIYGQWLRYHRQFSYVYQPDETLPNASIFDIDGTLARMVSRNPYDWDKVNQDVLREDVMDILKVRYDQGDKIILLSGRDSCCRELTEAWLNDNLVPYDQLLMRAEGDKRPDTEVKEELFINNVVPKYNVSIVVDDRPCMVRTWHRIGIPNVISVADPYLEF